MQRHGVSLPWGFVAMLLLVDEEMSIQLSLRVFTGGTNDRPIMKPQLFLAVAPEHM